MKNIIKIGSLTTFLLLAAGCGNQQVFDFNYTFDEAICNIGGEYQTIKIEKWNDYEGEQLQLIDKNGTVYLVSSINCTLIKRQEE